MQKFPALSGNTNKSTAAFLCRVSGQHSYWVSQRTAIGNELFAGNSKDVSDSNPAASEVREIGIRSVIRQRILEDAQPAAERPCTHCTDNHDYLAVASDYAHWQRQLSPEAKGSQASMQRLSAQKPQSAVSAGPQQLLPKRGSQTVLHQESSTTATSASATLTMPDVMSPSRSRLEDDGNARTTGSDPHSLPQLLERPEYVCDQQAQPAEYDVVSKRVQAAAPHYARAKQAEQEQEQRLRGRFLHAQRTLPISQLLCLWAVKLVLPHPVTKTMLKLSIQDPPVFEQIRTAEARLADLERL